MNPYTGMMIGVGIAGIGFVVTMLSIISMQMK